MKDTRWNWNNWREVIFRADGSFLAPAENCERQGNPQCRWYSDEDTVYVKCAHPLQTLPRARTHSLAREHTAHRWHVLTSRVHPPDAQLWRRWHAHVACRRRRQPRGRTCARRRRRDRDARGLIHRLEDIAPSAGPAALWRLSQSKSPDEGEAAMVHVVRRDRSIEDRGVR